jgi:RinA family phage transcriptional activator
MIEKGTFRMIESWLGKYQLWQVKIENLTVQLQELPRVTQKFEEVASFGGGFVSDSTYQTVERRLQVSEVELAKLQLRVQLLESALAALTKEEKEIVELKYFKGFSNQAVWEGLALSRRGFYRRRSNIIVKVYEALGGEMSPIWFEIGPVDKESHKGRIVAG